MKVNATVVTNMACNDAMLGQMICTDYPRTHDTKDCTGDFGGAYAVENTSEGFTLLGVVRLNRGCSTWGQDDYPEVFMKVAHYVEWILLTIRNN